MLFNIVSGIRRALWAAALLSCGCAAAGLFPARRLGYQVVTPTFGAPTGILRVAWSRSLVLGVQILGYKPQEFAAATSSGDGLVFIGSSYKEFMALRHGDGGIVWKRELTGGVSSEPLYLGAGVAGPQPVVVVGDDDGALTAMEARTGKVRWTYRVRGPIRVRPTFAEGMMYFTSGEGRLYAIDAKTGAWRWQYEREVPENFTIRGGAGALVQEGRVYTGFPDGYLAALNAANGEVVWTRQLSGDASRFTDVDGTPVMWQGTLYASSYASGVFALDPKDGSTRWRFDLEGAGALAVQPESGFIYVSAARSGIYCIDPRGRQVWRQAMDEAGELSLGTLWGPYLLISAAAGGLYVTDAASGRLLQYFDPGQGITGRPIASDGEVYILSNAASFFTLASLKGRG